MKNVLANQIAPIALLLCACYFAIFHQLDRLPLNLWDESVYALNASEMLESGKLIEVELLGQPDVFNTKPPFAIWCMVLCIKAVGFNELGIRLASAIFALLTCLLLFFLFRYITSNTWLALIPPFVLISSQGFVGYHVARTGDTDSILAFWNILQVISIYLWVEQRKTTWLYIFFLSLTLGCLTKGVAGLLVLPGIVVFVLVSKQFKSILSNGHFYIGVFAFCFFFFGYYFLRDFYQSGYINKVLRDELGGRITQQKFLNPEYLPWYWYFSEMVNAARLGTWIFMLPFSIVGVLKLPNSSKKRLGVSVGLGFLSVSILLGISSTKLQWYDATFYPIIAILIGIAFISFWEEHLKNKLILFLSIFAWPFFTVVKANIRENPYTHLPQYLDQLKPKESIQDTITIINSDPDFAVLCYQKMKSKNGRQYLVKHAFNDTLPINSLLITYKKERSDNVNQRYVLDTVSTYFECNLYRIKNYKFVHD